MTTIYRARKIITMNPSRPVATHVAVKDGRILGAGSLGRDGSVCCQYRMSGR